MHGYFFLTPYDLFLEASFGWGWLSDLLSEAGLYDRSFLWRTELTILEGKRLLTKNINVGSGLS